MSKPKPKLSDFRPQQINANAHSPRGMGLLSESMSSNGWAGAMTSAADGEIIDGSARIETAFGKFGEIEPIVIEIDGNRPVIVKRTDIPTADHPVAKKLAIAANRTAEINLNWDTEVLLELGEEIDLSEFWHDHELEELFNPGESETEGESDELQFTEQDSFGGFGGDKYALAIVLDEAQHQQWQEAKEILGVTKDTTAFLKLIQQWQESN